MKEKLISLLIQILKELGVENVVLTVERAGDLGHGDYTTNVAMVLAKVLKRRPLEIAEEIVRMLKVESLKFKANKHDLSTDQSGQKRSGSAKQNSVLQDIEKIEVAPPGFINFHLSASVLSKTLTQVLTAKEAYGTSNSSVKRQASSVKKKIMVEFAHPNTHKAFHIGHLRNITTGESIIRLLEFQGHEVIRVNYQGDVGMHIAKALYALLYIEEFKKKIKSYSSSEPQASREVMSFPRKRESVIKADPHFREDDKVSSRLSASSADRSNNKILKAKVELLGKAYAAGSKAFEDDEKSKETIKDINYLIYASVQRFNKERGIEPSSTDYMKFVHGRGVEVDQIYELWVSTRQWSLDYFDNIYKRVRSHYDRLYFESECLSGVDIAKDAVKKGILKESDGAIIFEGKPFGLDTRVFVNSLGLPTYEAKELALAQKEFSEFGNLNKIIHVVGPEQASFFKVTFKVEELLGLQKDQQYHLIYGWVKLKHGKMSSRSGNVVLGEWLLDEAKKAIYKIVESSVVGRQSSDIKVSIEEIAEKAAVAAVKYSFLKVGTLQEISFDIEESINFNGDSGPYLQYTYARCKSVLRKAPHPTPSPSKGEGRGEVNDEEKIILRLIRQFPEVVETAANNYAPSALCKYLYDLAGAYNTFYNKLSILGSENSREVKDFRLKLTEATAQVLKNGLYLLGIETLEQM